MLLCFNTRVSNMLFWTSPQRVLAAVMKYIFWCCTQTLWQIRSYRRAVTECQLHYGAQRWHVKWCVTAMPQALLALEPVTAEVSVHAFINSLRNEGYKLLSGIFIGVWMTPLRFMRHLMTEANQQWLLSIFSPVVNKIVLWVFFFYILIFLSLMYS